MNWKIFEWMYPFSIYVKYYINYMYVVWYWKDRSKSMENVNFRFLI